MCVCVYVYIYIYIYKDPCASITMIPQPYHPHSASCENVWQCVQLQTVVLQNKACQEYAAVATDKSSLV